MVLGAVVAFKNKGLDTRIHTYIHTYIHASLEYAGDIPNREV